MVGGQRSEVRGWFSRPNAAIIMFELKRNEQLASDCQPTSYLPSLISDLRPPTSDL